MVFTAFMNSSRRIVLSLYFDVSITGSKWRNVFILTRFSFDILLRRLLSSRHGASGFTYRAPIRALIKAVSAASWLVPPGSPSARAWENADGEPTGASDHGAGGKVGTRSGARDRAR